MSIPNLIPHKTLYISGYIYSYYAFVFIFEFPEHISKHILQAALAFPLSQVNTAVELYRNVSQQLKIANTLTLTIGKEAADHE